MFKAIHLPLCLMVAVMSAAESNPAKSGPLQTTLAVSTTKSGELCVSINLVNTSGKVVLLEKIGPAPAPMRQEFEIKQGSQSLEYVGPMVKRGPFVKADFFPLAPGEKHTRKVRLDNVYEFLAGTKRYELKYFYLCFDEAKGGAETYSSEGMGFTFKKHKP